LSDFLIYGARVGHAKSYLAAVEAKMKFDFAKAQKHLEVSGIGFPKRSSLLLIHLMFTSVGWSASGSRATRSSTVEESYG
jgi:hypothetical protein